jgi:hypothetical protein
MTRQHLSDDQIAESCFGESVEPRVTAHLSGCDGCRQRQAEVMGLLDDVSTAAALESDAVFSESWLSRQRARILHRIDHDGRPGKVIAFPASPYREAAVRHTRPAARLVAAGVAAGLAIGLLTGHLVSRPRLRNAGVAAQMSVVTSVRPTIRPVSTISSDDEFLGQVELAGGSGGPEALRPLDALTPRAWDVR